MLHRLMGPAAGASSDVKEALLQAQKAARLEASKRETVLKMKKESDAQVIKLQEKIKVGHHVTLLQQKS